jgi:H+/gluconate symporter-like permease
VRDRYRQKAKKQERRKAEKMITTIKYLVVTIIVVCICFLFQPKFTYSELKSYTDSLLNVSGMVFTMMGIWIAFLYPNALKRIVDSQKIFTADFSDTLSETKRLESLVASVLKSSIAIVVIILISLFKIVLSGSNVYADCLNNLKQVALFLVVFVTYLQLEAVWQVMASNFKFIEELHSKREQRQSDEDL